MTRTGNMGDSRQASAVRGHALLAAVRDRLCTIITALDKEAPAFQC
jgi:creatinine amidohydrolase/Fe(II)-dependent formamide hydrolase-like protein